MASPLAGVLARLCLRKAQAQAQACPPGQGAMKKQAPASACRAESQGQEGLEIDYRKS